MKQKWPILIFSALLTAFIVLAGIWGNAQFEHLHSGSMLTAEHAAQGIALDGWRQEAPGQWHFTFTVGEDIPSLTLCVTNTAAPLAHESLTSLERSGELYALDVTPGETVELVFTCGRSPQTWLMTSAFASRAFRFRTMTQLIALTAFVTMGMVLLALYHYKHLPELGYFLLYLVIMSAWALMVFFFPAIRNSLLQRILRSFFSLTVLARAAGGKTAPLRAGAPCACRRMRRLLCAVHEQLSPAAGRDAGSGHVPLPLLLNGRRERRL